MGWSCGEANHFTIFIEMESIGRKPPRIFNFNPNWIEEEDFARMVKYNWVPCDGTSNVLTTIVQQM